MADNLTVGHIMKMMAEKAAEEQRLRSEYPDLKRAHQQYRQAAELHEKYLQRDYLRYFLYNIKRYTRNKIKVSYWAKVFYERREHYQFLLKLYRDY